MQIVIDISETLKDIADKDDIKTFSHIIWQYILVDAIKNGTPLPKGHGRLIDVNDLLDRIGLEDNDSNREDNVGEIITLEDIDFIPAIIEADKPESEG